MDEGQNVKGEKMKIAGLGNVILAKNARRRNTKSDFLRLGAKT